MKNKKAYFTTIVFILTALGFGYYYITKDTHSMMFWGVLTLLNSQNLGAIKTD